MYCRDRKPKRKLDKTHFYYGYPDGDPFEDVDECLSTLLDIPKNLSFSTKVSGVMCEVYRKKDGGIMARVKGDAGHRNRNSSKIGATFEAITRRSFTEIRDIYPDFMFFKLQDTKSARIKTGNNAVYTEKVPADFMLITRNTVAFVECKTSSSAQGLDKRNIKPHQLMKSIEMDKLGHGGYFFIERRIPRGSVMYIVRGKDLVKLKTYSWKNIASVAEYEIQKKNGKYDLEEFMSGVY